MKIVFSKWILVIFLAIASVFMNACGGSSPSKGGNASGVQRIEFKQRSKMMKLYEKTLGNIEDKDPMYLTYNDGQLKRIAYTENSTDIPEYVYYGEDKNNMPDGEGVLFTTNVFNDQIVVTVLYIGNFEKGRFDGYGMKFDLLAKDTELMSLDAYGFTELRYEGIYDKGIFDKKGNLHFKRQHYDFSPNSVPQEYYIPFPAFAMRNDTDMNITLAPHVQKHVNDNFDVILEMKTLLDSGKTVIVTPIPPILDSPIVYAGELSDGKLEGNGKSYHDEVGNLEYDGEWQDDEMDGEGTLYFENGVVKYDGEFKNGLYHGKGTLFNSDGSINFKGKWKKGQID